MITTPKNRRNLRIYSIERFFGMYDKTENPGAFENLEKRVEFAKHNEDELEAIIKEYIPFIRKTALRVIPPGIYDDYSSTAMMAFSEAVSCFRAEKGGFLNFASFVIMNRIRDQVRKEFKDREIAYDEETLDKIETPDFSESMDRKIEINIFREELAGYGISMADLLKESPKHKSSRRNADWAAKVLAEEVELMEYLASKKMVPIKKLVKASGTKRKLIEQKRKYIIARAIIRKNDYRYLKEFID
jgi:RNA polymerase sigma factor